MKKLTMAGNLIAGLVAVACVYSCKKDGGQAAKKFNVTQVNLVADTAGYGAATIDTNLRNAWGITANPGGIIWVSSNHGGVSTIYDNLGRILRLPVTVPSAEPGGIGSATGIVFNGTTDFGASKFIFASEDGIISAWTANDAAVKVADRSQTGAVYKGLTMAADAGGNYLYAANFKGQKIDVFDNNFEYINSKPFLDPAIPAGFGPFNIQNIGGQLYVTYAKLKGPDNEDDDAAPGNGYIDIFKPDGTLVKRFASNGVLNSPWGIALAPAGFASDQQAILVGNFGDGRINIFDLAGNFKGALQNNGKPIAIDGLWAIDFLKNNQGGSATDPLYFTAGPLDETHGLLGYLKKE